MIPKKSMLLAAAGLAALLPLSACRQRADVRVDPLPMAALGAPQGGGPGGPSIQFYRHVLRADGTVVGEIIVVFIPQR